MNGSQPMQDRGTIFDGIVRHQQSNLVPGMHLTRFAGKGATPREPAEGAWTKYMNEMNSQRQTTYILAAAGLALLYVLVR
jgi:hypothetical protein